MEEALQRCGFNAATVRYLVAQGLATPDNLQLASERDHNTITRIVARTPPRGGGGLVMMPFIALKSTKGLRFWADERRRTGFDADPASFTANDVATFTSKCLEYHEQTEAAKDKDASRPDSLMKLTTWLLWNESFQNYLRQILKAAKIHLLYLTRDERNAPEGVDPTDFANSIEYLVEATIFRGCHCKLEIPK